MRGAATNRIRLYCVAGTVAVVVPVASAMVRGGLLGLIDIMLVSFIFMVSVMSELFSVLLLVLVVELALVRVEVAHDSADILSDASSID